MRELREKAPFTLKLLSAVATPTRPSRRGDPAAAAKTRDKSIVMAASVLLKSRNVRACAFQIKLGLTLKHYGLATPGIVILSSLNVTVHNNTIVEKRNNLESDFASNVNSWKKEIETTVGQGLFPKQLYSLVGDNFDLVGKVHGEHHQRHWFNSMAIKERPVDESLSRDHRVVRLSTAPVALFLPTLHDLHLLARSFLALWERIIVKRIPEFTEMGNVVDWHLHHKYAENSAEATDYVGFATFLHIFRKIFWIFAGHFGTDHEKRVCHNGHD